MLFMGKLTISMAIFHSYVTNYQKVYRFFDTTWDIRWAKGFQYIPMGFHVLNGYSYKKYSRGYHGDMGFDLTT